MNDPVEPPPGAGRTETILMAFAFGLAAEFGRRAGSWLADKFWPPESVAAPAVCEKEEAAATIDE